MQDFVPICVFINFNFFLTSKFHFLFNFEFLSHFEFVFQFSILYNSPFSPIFQFVQIMPSIWFKIPILFHSKSENNILWNQSAKMWNKQPKNVLLQTGKFAKSRLAKRQLLMSLTNFPSEIYADWQIYAKWLLTRM